MAFYTYMQTNSGGAFVEDAKRGITKYVIIEAASAESANIRALDIGLYFDEDCIRDCPCCGPRWSAAWESDDDPEPMVYGKSVFDWIEPYKVQTTDAYVHYLDGTVTPVNFKRGKRSR